MANVGGDPASMTGGAQTLHQVSLDLASMSEPVEAAGSTAAGGAPDPVSAAADRLAAALSAVLEASGTQTRAASQLAANAAADLSNATGS